MLRRVCGAQGACLLALQLPGLQLRSVQLVTGLPLLVLQPWTATPPHPTPTPPALPSDPSDHIEVGVEYRLV